MREPFTQVYLHLVWATWNRAPLLTPELWRAVDGCIRHECAQMRVEVVALGGVEDHVHLLVRIPMTLPIASLVKQVKGSSSHLLSERLKVPFRWQGGYGAFSVSKSAVARAREYVLNQERHHREGTTHRGAELSPEPAPHKR